MGFAGKEQNNRMSQVQINTPAPDFALTDLNGQPFRLSKQLQLGKVVLVFNRGFV